MRSWVRLKNGGVRRTHARCGKEKKMKSTSQLFSENIAWIACSVLFSEFSFFHTSILFPIAIFCLLFYLQFVFCKYSIMWMFGWSDHVFEMLIINKNTSILFFGQKKILVIHIYFKHILQFQPLNPSHLQSQPQVYFFVFLTLTFIL